MKLTNKHKITITNKGVSMKKMFTFAWLFLFIAVAVEAGSIPQWKKNKIEEMNKFETIKFKSGDNKINESFSWMPGFFVKDYDHYNFIVLEKATDNVAWLAGGSYSGSPKAGSIYGFIVDFTGQQPVTKSFKYADGYLGGLGGLAAFDASIAVMGLYTGELVRTTNGGQSWDTVHVYNNPDSAFIDGVKRIPGTDTVYAFGDADSKGVFVGISVNKGLTWTRLTVGPKGSKSTWWGYAGYNQCLATVPGKVWYTAYSYAVPQDSILISSSSNGGVTWDETSVFLKPNVATNYYFRSINFKDANVGYGVSRRSVLSTSSDNDNWYHKTTDGGKTWSDTISMEPGALHKTQKVYSVQSIPGSDWVLAVGFSSLTGSKSWLSKNGGSTFEVIKTPGVTNLTNFIALDTNKIIVGGYKQLMTKVPLSNSNLVVFEVNMNIQKNLKKFDPTKDSVYVRGNFMPGAWWESNAFKLADADGDLIYSGAYNMTTVPTKIAYKFIEIGPSTGGGSRWEEGMGDRIDTIPYAPLKLKTVYFENDSLSIFFNNDITFKVNMSYEMIKGKFNKATDSVVVRGDFNGWGGKKTLLSDADGDSIYTGTYNITSTPKFRFKFVKIQPTGEGWESSPDRWASGMTGPTTSLPLAWFNDAPNGVTFVVNMNQQLKAKKFDPKKDSVFVRGNFMPGEWWASNAFKLSDPDGDLFYSGIYYMPKLPLKIGYKFVQRGVTFPGDRWEEGIPDRTDSIVTGPYKIPAVYFENDSTSVYFDNNVTFSVNMKIQIKKSKFTKASDSVVVRGDFNGWGGKNTLLKDADGDSIYTGTYNIPSTKKFRFKFVTIAATGDGWESSPDRVAENLTGPTTVLPNYFFNNDSVIVNIVNVNWRVNMRVKLAEGAFKPASGHKVFVRGEMNGWSESDELLDADNDSVFSKKIAVDEGKEYKFKYMMKAGSDVWEGGSDKVYKVPVGGGDVPLLYFDGDSLVSKPTTGTIMYRVNLSAYEKAGWFKRTEGDSMQINGGFNSWSGTSLTRKSGTEIYELARTYNGFTYDQEDFKFFMKFNPTTVKARFPEYNEDTKSGFHYEHPADRGDGNRVFNYGNGGNIQTPVYMISDIDERGLISSGDTVTVKFTVDMTPALTHSIPFKPATDTVKIVFFDDLWRSVSKVPKSIVLQKIGANYFGQVNVIGKSHYNLLYQINYGTVTEGGGLGVQNPYRSRFITPLSANKFPRIYSTPVDVFKANAPLFGEKNPYAMGVIDQTVNFIPETYSLGQNYPNPFNPSTKIKYAIPQESIVRIRVFNMLGQVVATVIDTKQSAGEYVATFDATHLGSGAYFYSLEAGSFKSIKKMLLLK